MTLHTAKIEADFDYAAEAELFPQRSGKGSFRAIGFRRFGKAAEAIRFAIEELPAELFEGTWLGVGNERFGSDDIRRLYECARYPLARPAITGT